MNMFTKKKAIILNSEQQKDAFIEKLENAHIEYDIRENKDAYSDNHIEYIVRVPAEDFKKVC